MNPQRFIDFFTALGQHPNRVNDFVSAASADPALAAKLAAAVDADDNRAALRLMAEQQWSRVPGREAPAPAAPSGSRSPMSFEDRLLNDANIRKSIEESGQAYPAGNPEAIMEAMRRGPVQRRGRPKKATTEDSIRDLVAGQESVEEGYRRTAQAINEQELRFRQTPAGRFRDMHMGPMPLMNETPPSAAAIADDAAIPQTAPERIAAEFDRQIDPTPAERAPTISRWQTPDDEYINLVEQDLRRQPFVRQPDEGVMDAAPPEMYPQGRVPPKPRPRVGMSARDVATAVGAGALTAGALDLATRPSTTADLVAESRPGPRVGVTDEVPEPTTLQAPRDYSMEARALINRLNDMRRTAGGEVPEAPAIMQEVNRLLAMGNQTREATYVAAPQDDAGRSYQQAQGLIDQVNQMYRQGMSPNSPEVQRIMAQVRQLQAQGDAIRNRRAG